jgi:hypothetical protein
MLAAIGEEAANSASSRSHIGVKTQNQNIE